MGAHEPVTGYRTEKSLGAVVLAEDDMQKCVWVSGTLCVSSLSKTKLSSRCGTLRSPDAC